ncbi:hypothetical protein [Immundisolibacter cernigliae]|nr:hypothetical protein [Immundisolibacter cernigliae]
MKRIFVSPRMIANAAWQLLFSDTGRAPALRQVRRVVRIVPAPAADES